MEANQKLPSNQPAPLEPYTPDVKKLDLTNYSYNGFSNPPKYLKEVLARHLVGGLQEGDVELFTGEVWMNNKVLSSFYGYTHWVFREFPDEKMKALAFRKEAGINTISDLLAYYEFVFAAHISGTEEKWRYLLNDFEPLKPLLANVSWEDTDRLVRRILDIKKKLSRMPKYFDKDSDGGDQLIVRINEAATFHPKDLAVIGLLGCCIGIEVNEDDVDSSF